MKIVLRADLDKLGKRGDIVEVADGYARNYLLPRGHALVASKGVDAQAAAMRTARDRVDGKNREAAEGIARTLVAATVRIEGRAGAEGKLFGSITNQEIVDALKAQTNIDLDRKQLVNHDPIKQVGSHAVPVKLHTDVQVSLNVEVVADAE